MNISELEPSAELKLSRILEKLQDAYDIRLDFTKTDFEGAMKTYESCVSTCKHIVETTRHNTQNQNRKYQESRLIQEAIHIFLSEVAPNRFQRRLRTSQSFGVNNEQ